jgi:phosphatidylethanolamine-binding protein
MATSRPIDIPAAVFTQEDLNCTPASERDLIFSPADSLGTSLSSVDGDEVFLDAKQALKRQPVPNDSDSDLLLKHARLEDLSDDATAVPFGHGPDKWLYHPRSGLFDLTRHSPAKLLIRSHSENMTGLLLDPTRTILVIVDMQNYFIHPDCHAHPSGLATVTPILNAIQTCRAQGIQIAFLNWVISDPDLLAMPPAVQRGWSADRLKTHGIGWHVNLGHPLPQNQGRCLWQGSWNAQLFAPLAQAARSDQDVTFVKNRPSGMWAEECDMARYLRAHDKKTVLFAGVNTDQCVLGTLTDAYSKGFDCVLLRDCVATATKGFRAQELVEWNVERNYGFVLDTTDFCEARPL